MSALVLPLLSKGRQSASAVRIDFASAATAARFNALRDEWRAAASSSRASRAGMRVATVLPGFVNREMGYAFPSDKDLADALSTTLKTVQRGLVSLEKAGLIERLTIIKRDEKGEASGKLRRIYLTLPGMPEVNGQEVNGQVEVNGQKRGGERTDVRPNIPDRVIPDKEIHLHAGNVSVYACTREGRPPVCGDDFFLDTFDSVVTELTDGRDIAAGELDRIVQEAFNRTAALDTEAAPIDWKVIRDLRQRQTENWFLGRVGQLIHRQAAA